MLLQLQPSESLLTLIQSLMKMGQYVMFKKHIKLANKLFNKNGKTKVKLLNLNLMIKCKMEQTLKVAMLYCDRH